MLVGAGVLCVVIGLIFFVINRPSAQALAQKAPARFVSISAGTYHTCAVSTFFEAYCWGDNRSSQTGTPSATQQYTLTPTKVPQGAMPVGVKVRQVAAGRDHSCAVGSDAKVYCWGNNANGQLGTGDNTSSSAPVAVLQGAIPAGVTAQQVFTSGDGGTATSCLIGSDAWLYCWGAGANGKLGNGGTANALTPVALQRGVIPAGAVIKSASIGGFTACAIASNDQVYCWGLNSLGQLGNGTTGGSQATPVAVSQGARPNLQANEIQTSGYHACVIGTDSKPYCWGNNGGGRLGDNSTTSRTTPVAVSQGAVPTTAFAKALDVSDDNTCMLGTNGKMYCWGTNTYSRLGDNTTTDRLTPIEVLQGARPSGMVSSGITTGLDHTCVLAADGTAYCWGRNNYSQVGSSSQVVADPGTVGTAVAVTMPQREVMVPRHQTTYRAYQSSTTQNPGSPLAASSTAAQLPAIAGQFRLRIGVTNMADPLAIPVRQLSSGCLLAGNSSAQCWGTNSGANSGKVGDGTTVDRASPTEVVLPSGVTFTQIDSTQKESCGIGTNGLGYCWGSGDLGDGGPMQASAPGSPIVQTAMPSGAVLQQIGTAPSHVCLVASDTKGYCWGWGNSGRLGNGGTTDAKTPVAVSAGELPAGVGYKKLVGGDSGTCGLATNNWVYCWGNGNVGRLGNGTTPAVQSTAVSVSRGDIPTTTQVKDIAVGNWHSCALTYLNRVHCWGDRSSSRMGNNTTTGSQPTPGAISQGAMPSLDVSAVAAGYSHACVIAAANAKVYCWGDNSSGQLGNGSTTTPTVPVAVSAGVIPASARIVAITAHDSYSCALSSVGAVYCWGNGAGGRLGNGGATSSSTPVAMDTTGALNDTITTIKPGDSSLRLMYAPKGASATCAAVTSGWTSVEGSGQGMGYGATPPAHGTAITSLAADPTLPAVGGTASPQSVIRPTTGTQFFSNTATIAPKQTALYDFVLQDRTHMSNTAYCFRLEQTEGVLESYVQYPEIRTTPGDLAIRFVDASDTTISGAATNTPFTSAISQSSTQYTTGTLSNNGPKRLEIRNTLNAGWSLSLAATGGPTATWKTSDNLSSYPYNGAADDNGKLSLVMGSAFRVSLGNQPSGVACSTANTTLGSSSAFAPATNSLTLLTANANASFNCQWILSSVNLRQAIPKYQNPGSYSLDMTITAVSS